jgi:hypothetical protein
LAKSPCRKLFPKFRQKFRCQFFLDFFCFIAFSGVFQRREFKNTTKNVLQKKSRRKVSTKNSTKNPKPTFSLFFFNHVFGRFSARGVQKYEKNIGYRKKINLALVLFRTLTHPPTTGVTDFFFIGGPLDFFYWRPQLQADKRQRQGALGASALFGAGAPRTRHQHQSQSQGALFGRRRKIARATAHSTQQQHLTPGHRVSNNKQKQKTKGTSLYFAIARSSPPVAWTWTSSGYQQNYFSSFGIRHRGSPTLAGVHCQGETVRSRSRSGLADIRCGSELIRKELLR